MAASNSSISGFQDGSGSEVADASLTQDGELDDTTMVDHYVPQGRDMFYYEVLIRPSSMGDSDVCKARTRLGFYTCTRPPGTLSSGLQTDKGKGKNSSSCKLPSMGKMAESSIRLPSPLGLPFVYPETRAVLMRCPEWEVVSGDVVGCGVDFDDQIIFFIKNGMPMGVTTFAYFGIARVVTLVPAVELEPPSATVSVNFGHSPFRWNPPGKSEDTNLIPRALFNAYESFFVAASSWDIVHEQVDVSPDGRQLWKRRASHHERTNSVTTRATSLDTLTIGISYYEVEVLQAHKDGLISIGYEIRSRLPKNMAGSRSDLDHAVGAIHDSWGYNSDGIASHGNPMPDQYAPKFHAGDIIGCGTMYDLCGGSIFYTLNGSFLGIFFKDATERCESDEFFPSVSLCHPLDTVRANFGQQPFRYPIARIIRDSSRETQWPRPPKPPSFSSEIIYIILGGLAPNNDMDKTHMVSCSLVCRYWSRILSPYLFRTIKLQSKDEMDVMSAQVDNSNRQMSAAITSLTVHERAHDVWAYKVAMSLANRCHNLKTLTQERDPLDRLGWEIIRQCTPPGISRSLPALYSAYRAVTTFVLINQHFSSFAALTQLVSAFPVLKTLKCERITWDKRPDNPRLLRAPRCLSTIQVECCDTDWRMAQLFIARWGRLPLDWDPSSKSPELHRNDSLFVHGLLNTEDTQPFDTSELLFASSTDNHAWHLKMTLMDRSRTKAMKWDFIFCPRAIQDHIIKTCLTELRICMLNSFDPDEVGPRIPLLDKLFSEAPLHSSQM